MLIENISRTPDKEGENLARIVKYRRRRMERTLPKRYNVYFQLLKCTIPSRPITYISSSHPPSYNNNTMKSAGVQLTQLNCKVECVNNFYFLFLHLLLLCVLCAISLSLSHTPFLFPSEFCYVINWSVVCIGEEGRREWLYNYFWCFSKCPKCAQHIVCKSKYVCARTESYVEAYFFLSLNVSLLLK